MTTTRYILAFPLIGDDVARDIMNELAGYLGSTVVIKSKGQSRPISAIAFEPAVGRNIDDIFEVFTTMLLPFNLRELSEDYLLGTWVFRTGMKEPLYLTQQQCVEDCRIDELDYSLSIEASYEGVVLATAVYDSQFSIPSSKH